MLPGIVKAMNIRPLGARVVVLPLDESNVTAGGLYKPETSKEKSTRGKVVAVGPKVEDIVDGDEVLFTKYAGTELEVHNEKCVVLNMDDIIGVLEAD